MKMPTYEPTYLGERLKRIEKDYSMLAGWCQQQGRDELKPKQTEFELTAAIAQFFLENMQVTQVPIRNGHAPISLPLSKIIEGLKREGMIPVEATDEELLHLIEGSIDCLSNCWSSHVPK